MIPFARAVAPAVAAALCLAACGGSDSSAPADFAGTYDVSVKNGDNGCAYANWTSGTTTEHITYVVTQDGANVTGELKGLANVYFAALGIGALTGTVNGNHATMSAVGTTSVKDGDCAYFVKATIDLDILGNAVNGTVTYADQTNGNVSCGSKATCTSQQQLSGSRPPK